MQAIKLFVIAGLSLVSALAAPVLSSSDRPSGSWIGTNISFVAAESRHEEGPGLTPADRAYVQAGTNRFSFLIPPGLKLQASAEGRVSIASPDYEYHMIFRVIGPPLAEGAELSTNSCSQWIFTENPNARILNTFSAYADSRRGPAYDVAVVDSSGSMRRGQIVFIPSRAGVLEFNMFCGSENFESARRHLNTVLLTFRRGDKGGLNISPLSDKL